MIANEDKGHSIMKIEKILSFIQPRFTGEDRIRIAGRNLSRGALVPSNRETVTRQCCGDCGLQIGQCGCAMPTSMMVDSSVPGGSGGGFGLVANPDVPQCNPGCFPRSACDVRSGLFLYESYSQQLRSSRMRKTPYADPSYDCIFMDTIFSAITTALPGVPIDIPLFPTAGTFALFYYEIVAVDPTTQVQQVDYTSGQPRVEGCPVPCGSGDVQALAQLTEPPQGFCGIPLVAWLDRESENTPLIVPFTNNQAAGNLSVQVKGRGYCCNTRVC